MRTNEPNTLLRYARTRLLLRAGVSFAVMMVGFLAITVSVHFALRVWTSVSTSYTIVIPNILFAICTVAYFRRYVHANMTDAAFVLDAGCCFDQEFLTLVDPRISSSIFADAIHDRLVCNLSRRTRPAPLPSVWSEKNSWAFLPLALFVSTYSLTALVTPTPRSPLNAAAEASLQFIDISQNPSATIGLQQASENDTIVKSNDLSRRDALSNSDASTNPDDANARQGAGEGEGLAQGIATDDQADQSRIILEAGESDTLHPVFANTSPPRRDSFVQSIRMQNISVRYLMALEATQ